MAGKLRWQRVLGEIPGLAMIAGVVLWVFAPLASMRMLLVSGEVALSDFVHQHFAMRVELGRALAGGHLPIWTDSIFCGYPLYASATLGMLYPPNWLFAVLPPVVAANCVILLTNMMAGWFTYALCRSLRLGRGPATLGGMSFALCGFMVAHAKHLALTASAAWLPLELLVLERALRARDRSGVRAALWLGPLLAVQFLAGGIPIVYLSGVVLGGYALVRIWLQPCGWARWGKVLVLSILVLATLLATGMMAVQLLPALELAHASERGAGVNLLNADRYPMPLNDLLTFFWATAVGRAYDYSYDRIHPVLPGVFWEDYAYVGLLVVVLALVGLRSCWRRLPQARAVAAVGLGGLLLGMGSHTGAFLIAYHWLPGMHLFRFPQRFLLVPQLMLAILAAMALSLLLSRLAPRGRRVAVVLALVLLALDLHWAQARLNVYYDARAWMRPPTTTRLLQQKMQDGEDVRVASLLAAKVYARCYRLGLERHLRDAWVERGLLSPCANAAWGIPNANGYGELVPDWCTRVWFGQLHSGIVPKLEGMAYLSAAMRAGATRRIDRWFPAPGDDPGLKPLPQYAQILGAWNVRYLLSVWPVHDPALRLVTHADGIYLYENPYALGRAYVVARAVQARAERPGMNPFAAVPGQDYRQVVALQHPDGWGKGAFPAVPAGVRASRDRTRVQVEASAPAPAWLVLADTWYPGWTATVDGKRARVERANDAMRAVRLPAGRHRVEFRYRCQPLQTGLAVSLASLVVWGLAWALLPGRLVGKD